MARVIDAKGSKIIGHPAQIAELVHVLSGDGAAVVDLKNAELVVTEKPIDQGTVGRAIETLLARAAKAKAARRKKA